MIVCERNVLVVDRIGFLGACPDYWDNEKDSGRVSVVCVADMTVHLIEDNYSVCGTCLQADMDVAEGNGD